MICNNKYLEKSNNLQLQREISNICRDEYEYFLNKPNVIGVGCGYKVKNGFPTYKLCIQVFVKRKISKGLLSKNQLIPNCYKNISTDVIETGPFTSCSLTQRIRPVKGGYCISAYTDEGLFGTAGCLVTNGVSKFVLGANHVLANLNTLPIGHLIIQPAFQYGGSSATDTIAKLHRYVPLRFIEGTMRPTNFSDCALGLLTKPDILSNEIAFIGKLNGVKNPRLHEVVRKVGSTTELTQGTITSLNVTINFNYPNNKSCLFKDQIFTTRMSDTGDSGSVLVNKSNYAVGFLFAKSDVASVYSRMSIVLDQLDVYLVT